MRFKDKYKVIVHHTDWHYIIINTILISIVVALYVFAIFYGGYVHYSKDKDIQHEYHIRQQTISLINADRRERKFTPLTITKNAQAEAAMQAKEAYKVVNRQPRQSKYYIHTLHSNGYDAYTQRVANISKELQKYNKPRHHDYLENCAEIGFGKRFYKNQGFHLQPYHRVRTNMGLSTLVNNHFMKYDQSKQNIHRHNILHKHLKHMGIAVIYNHRTNHGVIVEEFSNPQRK